MLTSRALFFFLLLATTLHFSIVSSGCKGTDVSSTVKTQGGLLHKFKHTSQSFVTFFSEFSPGKFTQCSGVHIGRGVILSAAHCLGEITYNRLQKRNIFRPYRIAEITYHTKNSQMFDSNGNVILRGRAAIASPGDGESLAYNISVLRGNDDLLLHLDVGLMFTNLGIQGTAALPADSLNFFSMKYLPYYSRKILLHPSFKLFALGSGESTIIDDVAPGDRFEIWGGYARHSLNMGGFHNLAATALIALPSTDDLEEGQLSSGEGKLMSFPGGRRSTNDLTEGRLSSPRDVYRLINRQFSSLCYYLQELTNDQLSRLFHSSSAPSQLKGWCQEMLWFELSSKLWELYKIERREYPLDSDIKELPWDLSGNFGSDLDHLQLLSVISSKIFLSAPSPGDERASQLTLGNLDGFCAGDSGGPVYTKTSDKTTVVGIMNVAVSAPTDLCFKVISATNVYLIKDWILSEIER